MVSSPILTVLSALAFLLTVVGCDAPHDNPFDPSNSNYQPPVPPPAVTDLNLITDSLSAVRGLVTWTSPEGAAVYQLFNGPVGWDGRLLAGYTSYEGESPGIKPAGTVQQLWLDLTPGQTRVWALYSRSSEGLISDPSNLVTIRAPERDRPSLISGVAHSLYVRSWGWEDLVYLELNATVSDTDGVDSVWAQSDIGFIGNLNLTSGQSRWAGVFDEENLPGGKLEWLVGHPILIYCKDGLGHTSCSAPLTVVRVLYIPPIPDFPSDQDTVGVFPTLTWYGYRADFKYSFTIDVGLVRFPQNVKTLVYHHEGISADSTMHTLTSRLEPSLGDSTGNIDYYWTLSVVDEYGNRITSLENAFEVKNSE